MFGGVKILQSEHALAEIDKTPRTDDMREMVEELRRRGETRRVPTAFRTPHGIVMHPVLFSQLCRRRDLVREPLTRPFFDLWRF